MQNKKQKREKIPPLAAEGGGINSSNAGAQCGGIAYFDKDSVRKRGLTWNGSHLPYNSNNINKARAMRREMTPAEKKLWYGFLRTFKYRVLRQRPIDHYIADFYCAKLKLVIELDGKHHLDAIEYDKNRTNILQIYGLRILRFTNEQVLNDFTNVCKIIEEIPPLFPP
ncbi:MAG TPA: endonuclease domain-containing protein [Chitinispirillaceae bacterium]|nr:endonuclease domain-containing protein [Chitinispirillaceae bacterium]